MPALTAKPKSSASLQNRLTEIQSQWTLGQRLERQIAGRRRLAELASLVMAGSATAGLRVATAK